MRVFGLLLLTFLFYQTIHCFDTLEDMKRFAASVPEFPVPDTDDYAHPDYTSFYTAQVPGFFKKKLWSFLEFFHIKSKPVWTAESFRSALLKATGLLEKQSSNERSEKNATLISRYYVWGDLLGAYHSLIRALIYLNKKGVISKDLVLANDHFFIFNGNIVDTSAYLLETFTAVLTLITKNPGRVIYIAGKSEDTRMWKESGLTRELILKAAHLSTQIPPLEKEIAYFFQLLPSSLMIKSLNGFQLSISSKPLDATESNGPSAVKARIKSTDRSLFYQATDGLQQLPSEGDIALWSVFSSPTLTSKKIYQFVADSFVLVSPQDTFFKWTLTLFYKKPEDASFQTRTVNLLTGQPASAQPALAITDYEPLIVGSTMDLSKTSATLGKRLRSGLELRINKENWAGGIAGRPIQLVFLDDSYTPRISLQNILTLINKYQTKTILTPLGTPTVEAFLPLVENNKVAVIFPCTGAMIFRKPNLTSMVHLRTSYAREAEVLVTYAVKMLQARKFAMFYQDDSYGKAPLLAAEKTLKNLNISDWLATPYLRNNPNTDDAAAKILAYNPDVILFFSTHAPSAALIRKVGINRVASTIFMGISFLTDSFRNFLRRKGLELIMARVIPDPNLSDLEIVRNYQEDMRKSNPSSDFSVDSLEGYINADVFLYVISLLKEPITNSSIINSIEKIKNLSYKGLSLNFDPETRELLKDVWIDTGSGPWIRSDEIEQKIKSDL